MSVSNQNFLHKMLGTRSAKRRRPYLKKRNEHRLGAGRSYPRELGRWHTSSLNLASEPRTPPVWMFARWMICRRNGKRTSRPTRIMLTAVDFSPTSIRRQVADGRLGTTLGTYEYAARN